MFLSVRNRDRFWYLTKYVLKWLHNWTKSCSKFVLKIEFVLMESQCFHKVFHDHIFRFTIIFQGCIRHENGSWSKMFSLNTIGAEFFVTSKDSQNVLDYVSNQKCNSVKCNQKHFHKFLWHASENLSELTSAMKHSAVKVLWLLWWLCSQLTVKVSRMTSYLAILFLYC